MRVHTDDDKYYILADAVEECLAEEQSFCIVAGTHVSWFKLTIMEQSERLTSQATETFPSKSVADSTAVKSLHSGEMTVPKFYAGKKILLTGATGFMGKVLIEKLLRCCPDVGCIYCLIRPKNKQDIAQRMSDLTNWKVNGGLDL